MKKIIIALALAITVSAAHAGDIGTIVGTNILVGTAAGAALGSATAVPAYMEGGNVKVFAAGAGWGALVGAGLGLAYSVYNIYFHFDIHKDAKKAMTDGDFDIALDMTGIRFSKTF